MRGTQSHFGPASAQGEVPGEISWHGLDGQTDRGLEESRPANQEGRTGKHHQATPAQPHKQKLADTAGINRTIWGSRNANAP